MRESWSEFPHAFLLRGQESWTVVSMDPEQLQRLPGNAFYDQAPEGEDTIQGRTKQICGRRLRADMPSFASLRSKEPLEDLLAIALLGGAER